MLLALGLTLCVVPSRLWSGWTRNGSQDLYVVKLDPSGSSLVYATYIGGSDGEAGYGIAVDALGQAHVVGRTRSTDFPLMNPFQTIHGGEQDGFALALAVDGASLVYSTFLGGSSNDIASDVAIDSATSEPDGA